MRLPIDWKYYLLGLVVLATGCSQQPVQDFSHCELPGGKNIDYLFAEAGERLQDKQCLYYFDEYKSRLLMAAKGSPGAENEARFAGLMRTSIDAGIISRRQGQEFFSNYFDPEFYSVKREPRNACSALRSKEQMYADMRLELAHKREGMIEILADESRFHQAQRHYSNLQLVLDAVELACSESA